MAFGSFQASINAIGLIFFSQNAGVAFGLIEGVGGIGIGASGLFSSYFYSNYGFRSPFIAYAVVQLMILTVNHFMLNE